MNRFKVPIFCVSDTLRAFRIDWLSDLAARRGLIKAGSFSLGLFLSAYSTPSQPSLPQWEPAESSPHETRWVRRDAEGRVTESFVELQTGLNRTTPDGRWERATAEIEIVNGVGLVRNAQYQAIFSATSDAKDGTFDIQLPANAGRLRGQCIGLAYTDPKNGDSVFIGELKNVDGIVVGKHEVIYPDCFVGPVKADLRYRATVGSIVQDVILRSKIPPPEDFGMPGAKLEIWTEFMDSPEVRKTVSHVESRGKRRVDCSLDFGPMQIGAGRAYSEKNPGQVILGSEVLVHKEFEKIEGLQFLIESVPVEDLDLGDLPKREEARFDRANLKERLLARSLQSGRRKPESIASIYRESTERGTGSGRLRDVAFLDPSARAGFTLDFDLSASYTNLTFRSDTTYYASGIVNLYGTSVFEGGTVIKFAPTNAAQLIINSGATAQFRTSPYKPAIFCARDDSSAGVAITTNAISGFYADPALVFFASASFPAIDFKELRISDCKRGLYIGGSSGGNYNLLTHAQFVRCNQGLTVNSGLVNLRNVLFDGSSATTASSPITNFLAVSSQMRSEHVTVNGSSKLFQDYGGNTLALTNSLLIAVTNWGSSFTSVNNYTNASSSGLFAEVAAGKHYLSSGSSLRNAGLTNINAALATDLKRRTTYPPLVFSNTISVNTIFWPQAGRDIDIPDLGYHYTPLDYVFDTVIVTNATVTVTNGASIGTYFSYTLFLEDGARLVSGGSPTNFNRFVEYARVQEQPAWLGRSGYSPTTLIPYKFTNLLSGDLNVRFTEFLGSRTHILTQGDFQSDAITVRDCAFNLGGVSLQTEKNGSSTVAFNNNLFERTGLVVDATNTISFYNNLHYQGSVGVNNGVSNKITLKDNSYDNVTFGSQLDDVINGYNAYINCSGRLYPTNINDRVLASFIYTNGPLGSFYHFSTNLINVGSRNATSAALYHFTVPYTLIKETNSVVDIGYHYVATSAAGVPLDYDNDGKPDYFEDSTGDGSLSSGETDWQDANDVGLRVQITEPKANSNIP